VLTILLNLKNGGLFCSQSTRFIINSLIFQIVVNNYRMAKAGADVVGINCHFDPFVALETIKMMKAGLEAAGLHVYLMVQPVAFHTPDAGKHGYLNLPEFPFSLEPRVCTR
jgi:hypothetical protein